MECSYVEVFNPFQPDPDDSEIVFGRCTSPSERIKEINRKTIVTRRPSDEEFSWSKENTSFEVPSIRSEDFSATSEHSVSSYVQIEESSQSECVSETSSTRASLLDSAFIGDDSFLPRSRRSSNVEEDKANVFSSRCEKPPHAAADHLETLRRIENRMEHFRKKFHLSSPPSRSTEANDLKGCLDDSQERLTAGSLSPQTNVVGDRTMAFIKEVKKSTNYGKSGMPAFITHESVKAKNGGSSVACSAVEKLTPMVDEKEAESIDRIASTPIVIKHLRPLTFSGCKNERTNNSPSKFKGGGFRTLPCVLPNASTDGRSKSPRKFVEPVVVKRAFKF